MPTILPANIRLSAKQRQFLDEYARTGEAKRAALSIGYTKSSAPQMAKRILSSRVAQDYLATLRNKSQAITGYTVAKAMIETDHAIEFAREKGNAMAIVKAVELRCKLSGLLIERIHVEKVDLTEALRQADLRIIDVIQPTFELPAPTDCTAPDENSTGGGVGAGTPKVDGDGVE